MNFIKAAKKSNIVRRKDLIKHIGSDGKGWIDARYAFDQYRAVSWLHDIGRPFPLLTWIDLMADDWEYKKEPPK